MPRRTLLRLGGIVAAGLLAAPVSAQVDHRVNQGNAGQAGHALDANPGRWTGGLNQPSGRYDAGGYADAVITGNVTGLAGFRAYSPVHQSNQFRASLPSAGLSSFEGASVGLDDVLSNRGLTSTRYYGVQQTISDVGFIRAGMNAPGSSRLASPYVIPPRGGAPSVLPGTLGSGAVGQAGALQTTPDVGGGFRQHVFDPRSESSVEASRLDWGFRRAAGSSIFGMPPSPLGREPGLRESPSVFKRTLGEKSGGLPELAGEEADRDAAESDRSLAPGSRLPASPVGAAGPRGAMPSEGERPEEGDELRSEWVRPMRPTESPAETGADRFSDMLGAVRAASAQGKKRMVLEGGIAAPLPGSPGAPSLPPAAPSAPPAAGQQIKRRRPVLEGVADLAAAARWAGDLLENPVTTFAGRNQDRLNGYITSGEEALRRGEYYRAADLFELARTIDPANPLPWLHKGHALLAAGQYMSASGCLQQGIARFPQIAAFRLDLPSFGGQQAVFDARRADLEKRLTITEHYELRFLLGYLELYSGLPEEGLRDLDLAAKEAPPDGIIAVFADLVSGRKEIPAPTDDSNAEKGLRRPE